MTLSRLIVELSFFKFICFYFTYRHLQESWAFFDWAFGLY